MQAKFCNPSRSPLFLPACLTAGTCFATVKKTCLHCCVDRGPVDQVLSFPADVGHVIQNALIIQNSVERLVLVDQQPDAMRLIRAQTDVQVCCLLLPCCLYAQSPANHPQPSGWLDQKEQLLWLTHMHSTNTAYDSDAGFH